MKYIISTLLILTFLVQGFSQNINFTLANPQPAIYEVVQGSIKSGDLDGDGDMDLLQCGIGGQALPAIFINDGVGNFTPGQQDFNITSATAGFVMSDLDNDGDLDIIMTATNSTDLYLNNGQAQFLYDPNTPFLPSAYGDLIAGDVDGDGDNDVIQFGKTSLTSSAPYFALLFLNDGSGSFTQSQNITFLPFENLKLEFIDLEGDGDLDILSFGLDENIDTAMVAQVAVFENDGTGNYSIFSNSNIAPHLAEGISVGDVDNDGDQDVLISGRIDDGVAKTALYINDGNGQFIELMNTPFPDMLASTNAFADLDNDNDLDVVLAGGTGSDPGIVFENLGNNGFIATDSLVPTFFPRMTIADFTGDGKKDIIIQANGSETNVYWNETLLSSVIENSNITFAVFPNPSNGQLQIEWREGAFNRVEIHDQNGKLILGETINGQGLHNMDINLPSGIYILKMLGEEIISTQKIILMK